MGTDANPGDAGPGAVGSRAAGPDDPDDAAALARYADDLATGIVDALPGWVERSVERLLLAYRGRIERSEQEAATDAGQAAVAEVGPAVRTLLTTDVDEQRTGPLAVARGAVRYPTAVLQGAGVPPVVRDAVAERQFPDDIYDLAPATFADLDPALHDLGIRWGAAKAHVHLARRRREGRR